MFKKIFVLALCAMLLMTCAMAESWTAPADGDPIGLEGDLGLCIGDTWFPILNYFDDLQAALGLTCVFIGHGLGAVHYISHRIAVMYMGRVVETGPSDEVFDHPAHPYTRALLDAAPSADYALRDRPRVMLKGELDDAPRPGARRKSAARCSSPVPPAGRSTAPKAKTSAQRRATAPSARTPAAGSAPYAPRRPGCRPGEYKPGRGTNGPG